MQRAIRVTAFTLLIAVSTFAVTRDFWHELMLGNDRFVRGRLVYAYLKQQRNDNREHQYPPVTVLSCADSRVPPELIFDHSIGEIFVIRVAGNVTDQFPLASIEYAVAKGYTKMIVVMGHQDCGAVKAAIEGKPTGSDDLDALVKRIKDNIGSTTDLKAATDLNARKSAEYLTDKSEIIRDAVRDKKVEIVVAYYDFDGRVTKVN
jgi:carbonic anhydrase